MRWGVLLIALPIAFSAATYIYKRLWPVPEASIKLDAKDFWLLENVNAIRPDLVKGICLYECDKVDQIPKMILKAPPFTTPNGEEAATFRVEVRVGGAYQLSIEYAVGKTNYYTNDKLTGSDSAPRPVDIKVNEKVVFTNVLRGLSGSWCLTRWDIVGEIHLKRGLKFIKIYRNSYCPHLKSIRLIRQ